MNNNTEEQIKQRALLDFAQTMEASEHPTINVQLYTVGSCKQYVSDIIELKIPDFQLARDFDIYCHHLQGLFLGWLTSGLISSELYDQFKKDLNSAICLRLQELLA
jgi:hypothetical protein